MSNAEAAAHLQGLAVGSAFGFAIGANFGFTGAVILLPLALLVLYGAYRLEKPIG